MILDSVLGQRIHDELTSSIDKETDALIKAPTEGRAGYIRGLRDARALLEKTVDDYQKPKQGAPVVRTSQN